MNQQPTSDCSCTLIRVDEYSSDAILYELIRVPKGPEHIFVVAGTHEFLRPRRCKLKQRIHSKAKYMELPYELHLLNQCRPIIGFWRFIHKEKQELKDWFDMNASEGIYPQIPKTHGELL